MTATGSKKNANDPPRDELLARFFSHQKTGALLKGMGLFIMDCSRNVFVPNTLWKELGYTADEMEGDRWLDAIHPEDRASVTAADRLLRSSSADSWSSEYRIRSVDGDYRWIRHKSLVLERDGNGVPTLFVGWDTDITDLVERIDRAVADKDFQERRFLRSETIRTAGAILSSELDPLRAAERVLAQAELVVPFDTASVWTLDSDQLIRLAVRGQGPEDGARKEAISDESLRLLLDLRGPRTTRLPNDRHPSRLEVPLLVRGRVQGVIEFRSAEEDAFGPEEIGAAVQFADHAVVALANALRYRATELEAATDWLTGLPTRRAFMKRAGRLVEDFPESVDLSALMIDIDRFKLVNDTYGHKTGDEVLAAVANACRDALRTQDLCCRYGGEEIVVLLPQTDRRTAFRIGERIRKKIERIQYLEHPELAVTVSVGICTRTVGDDFRELISDADEALYMAKSSGRNRCEMKDEVNCLEEADA